MSVRASGDRAPFTSDLRGLIHERSGLLPRRVESRKCTTFSIGGVFENLYEPQSVTEVASLVGAFWMYGVSWLPLGAGSNLLVADRTFHEPVIRLGQGLRGYSFLEDGSIEVAAGASLMTLSRESAARGLTGLEFAGGIPASLGGAVRMNAGAHGGELFDVLRSIEVVTAHGETKLLAREEIPHSYRHTELPSGALVTRVWLKLRPDDPGAVQERRAHFLKERKTRQPLSLPSAGSVFKNPSSELSAGRAIEDAGLKGREEGGAQVSTLHANWIVNPRRRASFADVESLMQQCEEAVLERQGVRLQREIVMWR